MTRITIKELEEIQIATNPVAREKILKNRAFVASLPFYEGAEKFSAWCEVIITCRNCGRQEGSAGVLNDYIMHCPCQGGCKMSVWDTTHKLRPENIRPSNY